MGDRQQDQAEASEGGRFGEERRSSEPGPGSRGGVAGMAANRQEGHVSGLLAVGTEERVRIQESTCFWLKWVEALNKQKKVGGNPCFVHALMVNVAF